MTLPIKKRISAGLCVALILAVAIHLASAGWHVFFGALNPDEGFYAVATRAVANGETPYRDFGFTQPPLVLYVNSLPLRLAGGGLFAQRVINGLWGALALALAAIWLGRRTRCSWGIIFAVTFSLSAPWMYFIHLGKTYALTSLLAVAASWIFLQMRAGGRRAFWLGLVTALGVGCRLPAAPFFGILWVLAWLPRYRPDSRTILAGLAGVALGATPLLICWAVAPEQMQFWVVDFHRLSVPHKNWHLVWREIFALAPALFILVPAIAIIALGEGRWRSREAGVLLAAGTALAVNLLPGGVYEEYGVPFLLPLAMASAGLWYEVAGRTGKPRQSVVFGVLAATQLLAAPLLFWKLLPQRRGTASWCLPFNAPSYDRGLPAQLAAARRVVTDLLPPDAPFIGPNLILAAETGRAVPPELRMGPFAFTNEMSPERAAFLHLATPALLARWFSQPNVTVMAFFNREHLNYSWSMPSFTRLPNDLKRDRLDQLGRDFAIIHRSENFLLLARLPAPPRPPR
jgi:hypothetical protein